MAVGGGLRVSLVRLGAFPRFTTFRSRVAISRLPRKPNQSGRGRIAHQHVVLNTKRERRIGRRTRYGGAADAVRHARSNDCIMLAKAALKTAITSEMELPALLPPVPATNSTPQRVVAMSALPPTDSCTATYRIAIRSPRRRERGA